MKTTVQLIHELTEDHKKVARNFSPAIRLIIFLYGTFILASALLYLRIPFIFKLQNKFHMVEVLCMFLFINAFTYFAFQALVPGRNKTKSFFILVFTLVLMILALSYRLFHPQTYNVVRTYCEIEAIAVSIVTTILGHWLISKSEFAKNRRFGYLIFFALPMMATFFLHLTCQLTFFHVLSCHIISPILVPFTYVFINSQMKNYKMI